MDTGTETDKEKWDHCSLQDSSINAGFVCVLKLQKPHTLIGIFYFFLIISIQSHVKPNYAGVICTHTVTHGKDTMAYLTIVFVIDGVSTGELFKEKEKNKNLKQSFLPKFKNVPYNNLTLIVQMIFQS